MFRYIVCFLTNYAINILQTGNCKKKLTLQAIILEFLKYITTTKIC